MHVAHRIHIPTEFEAGALRRLLDVLELAMIPQSVRIFVCTVRQAMRRSFDALALEVKARLAQDPQYGALFVFATKRANRLGAFIERTFSCPIPRRRIGR